MIHLLLTKPSNKDVIKYLLLKMGKIEGRKKLMKLMFLIEHYDPETGDFRKEPLLGNEYIVYHYGPFSFQVYDDFIEMVNKGEIEETWYSITLKKRKEVYLPEDIKKRIDKIIEEFGKKSPSEIEAFTLNLIKIDRQNKEPYFGKRVVEVVLNG